MFWLKFLTALNVSVATGRADDRGKCPCRGVAGDGGNGGGRHPVDQEFSFSWRINLILTSLDVNFFFSKLIHRRLTWTPVK